MKQFNVEAATEGCIKWIRNWIDTCCPGHKVVVGLSGGKDSTIVAALCARALGPENVIGVGIPGKGQDLHDADKIAEYLGIEFYRFPIGVLEEAYKDIFESIGLTMSAQTEMNIPPRLRMTTLYAIGQSLKGGVVNTCNYSEDYIGYSTLFGDCAGSFAPVRMFTATEVIAIGDYMGLPARWTHKTPDDGLPNSSPDEEKFGFTYKTLDDFIRGYAMPSQEIQDNIQRRHVQNLFKLEIVQIPAYDYFNEE